MTAFLLIFTIVATLFLLLWIPLLGVGIYRLKKYGVKPAGVVMTILGGVWGLGAVGMMSVVLLFVLQFQAYKPQTFDPATYDGPTGKIEFPFSSDIQLNVTGDDGTIISTEANGDIVELPTGSYSIYSYTFQRKDKDKKVWSLRITPKNNEKINLSEEKVSKLQMGPPLNMWITTRKKGTDSFSFSLTSKDRYGNSANLSSYSAGPPKFQILSMDDKILKEGSFEYGWGGTCSYSGRILDSMKGKVKIRPVLPGKSPFEIKLVDKTVEF